MEEYRIRLMQYDAEHPAGQLLADGPLIMKEQTLIYHELADHSIQHEIRVADSELVLCRKAEISSETHLFPDQPGYALVHSPYGDLRLGTRLLHWEKGNQSLQAEYEILQGEDAVGRFRLIWQWEEIHEQD
jgi:uncharacterized beta-barrel protein YwiB (DUF1934 family)